MSVFSAEVEAWMDENFDPYWVAVEDWGGLTEGWLKRMIAYWGDDLGVPSGRNDVARTHEEYDVTEARRECLWPDKEFGPFRYRAHDNRLNHTSLFYLFPEGRARANVPADKDKRVRLAYLMASADHYLAAHLDEYSRLRDEVSPWGKPVGIGRSGLFIEEGGTMPTAARLTHDRLEVTGTHNLLPSGADARVLYAPPKNP